MAEKIIDPKNLKTTLTRKVGPAPVWVWVVVGVGVLYVYKRATSPAAPAGKTETSDVAYGEEEGYPAYAGYGGTTPYDAGSASYDGGGGGSSDFPESIPLTFEGSIPVDVSIARGGRRHDRNPKVKKITKRIQTLKEGGVTKPERAKIKRLRARRRSLRG
jgi:hypothetical protein